MIWFSSNSVYHQKHVKNQVHGPGYCCSCNFIITTHKSNPHPYYVHCVLILIVWFPLKRAALNPITEFQNPQRGKNSHQEDEGTHRVTHRGEGVGEPVFGRFPLPGPRRTFWVLCWGTFMVCSSPPGTIPGLHSWEPKQMTPLFSWSRKQNLWWRGSRAGLQSGISSCLQRESPHCVCTWPFSVHGERSRRRAREREWEGKSLICCYEDTSLIDQGPLIFSL